MSLLKNVHSPRDLNKLTTAQLTDLAAEIRRFLVKSVAQTGGHLGPNLGVVELTIALHRIFQSPGDTIIFDTGHQAYVHKLLTGRQDFSHLRSRGGLSGYPSRSESVHDVVENSHASTSLAWADGISRADTLLGSGGHVVAVIGDGAMTGGLAWEALNNIATENHGRLIIVVNDNGRSYAPTIGGLAHHLDALRVNPGYTRMLKWGKRALTGGGKAANLTYDVLHGVKAGIKDVLTQQAMFDNLGIKYTGPVDGHDLVALEFALSRLKTTTEPVILHVITKKGKGYTPAETHESDLFHSVGPIHPETGLPVDPQRFEWTSVFAEELVKHGRVNPKLVAITAAMLEPVGLAPFKEAFPDRVFDVGIAEQEALTSAAGMAYRGLHPVFAVYSTFLNRAYDQLLLDCALHRAAVTVVEDRAGITGNDGPSHHGMWDIALAATIPGLYLAAPRDEATLRRDLAAALAITDGPTVVRYPKGALPRPIPAVGQIGDLDVLSSPTAWKESGIEAFCHDCLRPEEASIMEQTEPGTDTTKKLENNPGDKNPTVLIVATGAFANLGMAAAQQLADKYSVLVVDPHWLLPISKSLVDLSARVKVVATLEDGLVDGGFGASVRQSLAEQDIFTPVLTFGVSKSFIAHSSRAEILADEGLEPGPVAEKIRQHLSRRGL